LTAHPDPFFFRIRAIHLIVFVGILILLPAGAALPDSPAGDSRATLPVIGIELETPRDNQVFSVDVVPPQIWVAGQVKTATPIESIMVTSGAGYVDCGKNSSFGCTVPVLKGSDTITVTVQDISGNTAEVIREISVRSGGPVQPVRITVAGTIRTSDDQPLAGATIRSVSESWPASTVSGPDGSYRISNAYGYNQTLMIEKDGYLTVSRTIVFTQNLNTADFTLAPVTKPSPGFAGGLCLCAIFVTGIVILHLRR